MPRHSIFGAVLFAAFASLPLAQAAQSVTFDADGRSGGESIGGLVWGAGNALIVGALPIDPVAGNDTQVYYQAKLTGVLDAAGNPLPTPAGLDSSHEITVVAGYGEHAQATSLSSVALTADTGAGHENFFRVYYDDLSVPGSRADAGAGTGYANGTLILAGNVLDGGGTFAGTLCAFGGIPANGQFCVGTPLTSGFGAGLIVDAQLDRSSAGNGSPGIATILGAGTTRLTADVTYRDPRFFEDDFGALTLELDTAAPYVATVPSALFTHLQDFGDITPTQPGSSMVGPINGFSGPGMMLETYGRAGFISAVPELDSASLLGVGLAIVPVIAGWAGSRRAAGAVRAA